MSATSTSNDPIQTIIDLLTGEPNTAWHADTPPTDIENRWDTGQQARMNNSDPALYVWTPTDAGFEDFSADGERLVEDRTIQVEVWSYTESKTRLYHQDLINILSDYMRDNQQNTQWHQITPDSASDYRQEKNAQRTEHYVMTVNFSLDKLREV